MNIIMRQSAGKSTAISLERTKVTILRNSVIVSYIHYKIEIKRNHYFQVSQGKYILLQPIH